MSKEDIAFQKLAAQLCSQDETLEELKAAAFEVLLLNPGCEQSDWAQILARQYATELTDAYGTDPADVYASLADLWESPYTDRRSGLEYTFSTWACAFSTGAAIQMYYDLTENGGMADT